MRNKEILFSCGEFAEKLIVVIYNMYRISNTLNPFSQDRIISAMFNSLNKVKLKYFRKRIKATLRKFEEKGLLLIETQKNGEYKIKFTKKGIFFAKTKIITGEFKNYKKIDNEKKRIVFFDIPERFKKYRNYLRNFLKLMGYKEIQKSVFVAEYENIEDLRMIITGLGIENYVKTGFLEEQDIKNPME